MVDSVAIGLIATGAVVGFLLLLVILWCIYVVYLRKKCFGDDVDDDDDDLEESLGRGMGLSKPPPPSSSQPNGAVRQREAKTPSPEPITDETANLSPVPLLKDNPLFDEREFLYDFDNPTYDREYGSKYDATVKIQCFYRGYKQRKAYSRIRAAIVTIQKFVRGFIARRRVSKYRVHKEEMRKAGQMTLKKKTSLLRGLALFDVKALGSIKVSEARGESVVQDAITLLRKQLGGKRKKRLKISVSPHGIKLFNASSMTQLDHIRITTVTYCSADPKQNKVFAFIQKKASDQFVCHVFHCINNNADELAKTVSEAYALIYQRVQKVREHKARQEAAQLAAKQAAEEAKRLESDLDVRLEEIEDDFADLYELVHKRKGAKIFTASSSLEDILDATMDDENAFEDSATSSEDEDQANIPKVPTTTSLVTKSRTSLDDFAPTPLPLKRGEFREAMKEMETAGEPGLDDAIAKFLRGDNES